ncbi:MAG: hypothetical protein CVT92_16260 [Bacteroidetes bacterium HGW-Bacteroidetes-1]|jgi:hypothetical protein|nr:MAG: hypothetical protein CVT92_16260 [Bacteroidetes bacterium HGW-Bacteroidetes-1]
MSASIFDLKNITPNDAMLAQELGVAMDWLNQIRDFIENNYGDLSLEWKYCGQKSGWVLKIFNKKRNVLFVVPLHGSFKIAFTFGEKAFNIIMDSDVPDYIKQALLNASKYTEGRPVQLLISSNEQLPPVLELIVIKLKS